MTVRWDKVHVFVSSTFNDMHAERDYLVKQVFPQLQEWCERRKLRLVDIDLRWGVTEQDATQNKRVVQVCLERIDACRPFFLCFLGQRRGWVPDKGDISPETYECYPELETYSGAASVTEMEILHALVHPLHRGQVIQEDGQVAEYDPARHTFFYLRQSGYLDELPADVPQLRQVYTNEGSADPARDDAELNRWRDVEIPNTGRPVHAYESHWDRDEETPEIRLPLACPSTAEQGSDAWQAAHERWAGKWAQADVQVEERGEISDADQLVKARQYNERLTRGRLRDFTCEEQPLADSILAELKSAIEDRYPEHVERVDPTPLQRELDQQEQFLQAASEGFIERPGDLEDLNRYVQEDCSQLFVLTAPGGMGKTSLLAHWIDRVKLDRAVGESLHYRFIGMSDGSTTVDALLRSLLHELKDVAGKMSDEIPIDPAELRAELPQLLAAAGQTGKTVIVLDGLNQLESKLGDLAWLPLTLPANVKIVASFKRGESQAEAYYERLRSGGQALLAEVKPFAILDDRRKLVRAYLDQFLKELDEGYIETLIRSPGAENPLYLKVVLAELRVFGAFGNLGEKIGADFGEDPVSAFNGVLARLESDPAYSPIQPEELVPRLFGWLAHARQGLSVVELSGLLVQEGLLPDDEGGWQKAEAAVHGLVHQMRPYLSRRGGRLDFFFESLRLAVAGRYVRGEGEERLVHPQARPAKEWHAALAGYFARQPLRLGAGQAPNRHTLAELPFQLAYAGQGEELARTLFDYRFIQARLEGADVQSLITDYDLAGVPGTGLSEEKGRSVGLVQGALRLSAHVIGPDPAQLPSQITGRLLGREEAEIGELLAKARQNTKTPWLRLLSPSLTRPGGPVIRMLEGHTDKVGAVAVTPNGRRAVSGSHDNTLKVWDLETGVELVTMRGHDSIIVQVTVTPDGRRVVSRHGDRRLKVWDLESGAELDPLHGHTDRPTVIALTPDGRRAVSRLSDKTLTVWDVESGAELSILCGHTDRVTVAALTPGGQRVMSGSQDNTLKVWDVESGDELATLRGHTGAVTALALTPDGRRAVSGSKDKTLKVWDLETGAELVTLDGGSGEVTVVAVTPDGRRAVSVSWGTLLQVWDLESEVELAPPDQWENYKYPVAVTPDGRQAVSGSDPETRDGTLKVWDLETWVEPLTAHGHNYEVTAVAVTPDGRRAVSGSQDKTLKVWDAGSGAELATLRGHSAGVKAVAVTPDGGRAVSGSKDKTLKVWDLESGAELVTLHGHTGEVTVVAVTPDGRRVVSGSKDRTLKLWDLESGAELATLRGHGWGVHALALTPDGRRAVWGSGDKTLKVWDLESGAELATLHERAGDVGAVAVTPDGRRAVSGSGDKTLKVWDLDTGTELASLHGHTGKVTVVAVTPDGRRAVSGAWNGTLKVWDLESGAELSTLRGHAGPVYAVAVTPDGRRAMSGSWDETLKAWDLATGDCLYTLIGYTGQFTAVAVTPDGKLAVSVSRAKALRVLDLESGEEPSSSRGHIGEVHAVAVTPDGRRAVSGSQDKTLKVWDVESGAELATLRGHTWGVCAVAMTPDGQQVVSGSEDKTLKVWDVGSGADLATLHGHSRQVCAVAVTPDGRRVVSGSGDETLKVWDLESGAELATLHGHTHDVTVVAVTPDGRRAVSGSEDRTLKLWDLDTGTELASLHGHTGKVTVVAVTPDGRRVVSGSKDRTLKVWDLESGTELATLRGHGWGVHALALTPDGRRAVSGSWDKTVSVWNVESGAELPRLRGHTDGVRAVAVTPDGRRAVSMSRDKTLRLWDLESCAELATIKLEAVLWAWDWAPDGQTFIACGDSQRVHILRLENTAAGPTVSTAWRRPGLIIRPVAFGCLHCRVWSKVPPNAVGSKIACPNCGQQVILNAFTIDADWRPVAAAWRGE